MDTVVTEWCVLCAGAFFDAFNTYILTEKAKCK